MTDNELLLALSSLFDKKLKPIENRLTNIETKVEEIDTRLRRVEAKVDRLEVRVDSLEARVGSLETKFENLETKFEYFETQFDYLKAKVENDICPKLYKMDLMMENEFSPRLQTIEACYTSTYDRYRNSVETYATMQADVELLKIVAAEHSEKLQRLA